MIHALKTWTLPLLLVCVLLGSGAMGVEHLSPSKDTLVPLTGYPLYVENLTVGSPISDHGSHYGIKATVDDDGDIASPLFVSHDFFLNTAHYAAFTSMARQVDQSHFLVRDEDSGIVFLGPAEQRTIEFTPFGWTEEASDRGIQARAWAHTLSEDAFLFHVRITSTWQNTARLAPVLTFHKDRDGADESLKVLPLNVSYTVEWIPLENMAVMGIEKEGTLARAVRTDFAMRTVEVTDNGETLTLEGIPVEIAPGGSRDFYWVLSAELSPDEAYGLASAGFASVGGDPSGAWARAEADWSGFLDGLPVPHADVQAMTRLHRMAAIGLRMNRYAPRNRMTAFCSVPAKAHFNVFWGWDTAFQAMGQAHWDTALAKENLLTLFSGPHGRPYLEMGDELTPTYGEELTQPPVQGWALWDVFIKDGSGDADWLAEMYARSADYMRWWEQERDSDGNGLFEYALSLETGWDDSPRFHAGMGSTSINLKAVDNINPLDLNCWMFLYYRSLARMASTLGSGDEAHEWNARADSLASLIETVLYDEESGTYFDDERNVSEYHSFNRVLTPAMFFPFFAGVSANAQRARNILERYLLEPGVFGGSEQQGTYPVPTVAFSDSAYDHTGDGFYWQGQIWLLTTYAAVTALYRYGYEQEAAELRDRTLQMMIAAEPGGIFENYDAVGGEVGFGLSGRLLSRPGEPSAFLFGWSCTFVMELLSDRYQAERFLMPGETDFGGYVREVRNLLTGETFYTAGENEANPPRSDVASEAGQELFTAAEAITVRLTDPYGTAGSDAVTVRFATIEDAKVYAVDADGERRRVSLIEDGSGTAWEALVSGSDGAPDHYLVEAGESETDEGEGDDYACGCNQASAPGDSMDWALLLLLLIACLSARAIGRLPR